MTRIAICDVCKTRHNKLTRATKYIHIKGRNDLRLDLCGVHLTGLDKRFPKVTAEYVQFVYEMAHGTELSLEDAEDVLRNKR